MRSGTSFLHHALSMHPGIKTSRTKELQFFSHGWDGDGHGYRSSQTLAGRWLDRLRGRRPRIALDSSPYYLFHPQAAARARQTLDDGARFIVLLREPGARAWSHYRHELRRGTEHLGFLEAIEKEGARLAGEVERIGAGRERADAPHQVFSYIARGRYADQLRNWWAHFPRERFLLIRSEEMFADPQAVFDSVCDFVALPRMTLSEGLERNALAPDPIPARARALLDTLFAEPNADLAALTGIAFGDPHGFDSCGR